ncbi:MAG: response regulator receiver sensor signal transduction histidine kinase [uncultured bacterium]|uniref:histidine kinase n=1 Tax=Candidatus Wallbacteria bacterium GWC2_49_35 TaxID=1817813 RepID=A0A1F7WZC8_9BACT|nr:MAG: response regulator receiver sensor signal transduction histidine kinase [uncultured bacterium]OGM08097.1 MAG: hypothetical protein A2008_09185 [Candidatus Wallbacteria bacterium GWC2_49_35]HBC73747.1 hypothetical protein [Candidatus Wallbacteria bacterium]
MLDLKTLAVITSLETICCAIIILYLNRRREYPGVRDIGIGMLGSCVAGMLMSMQGVAPAFLSIIVFGAMTVFSMCLINYGFHLFLNLKADIRICYILTAVSFLLGFYFTEIKSDYTMRVIFISAICFFVFIDNFRILYFRYLPEIKNLCRFNGIVYLFLVFVFLARAALVFFIPEMRANFIMETGTGLNCHYYLSLVTVGTTFISLFMTFVCVIFMILFRLEAELKAKTERLVELNGDRERFLSIISHDLISPLSSIPGIANLLLDKFDTFSSDKIKEFLRDIHSASTRVFSLLDNLMTWSKASMGRFPFAPSENNIFEIFTGIIKLYEEAAKNKSISVVNLIPQNLSAYCDQDMAQTIARNLFANALKFSADKGVIELSGEEKGGAVVFTVKDNGSGMDESTLSKLFKIGERVGKPGSDGEKGNGIGLLIVKELIDKHGGKISVESAKNSGAKFTVEFPAKSIKG